MTMDLINLSNDRLNFPIVVWSKLLFLAQLYGWEPIGTVDMQDGTTISAGEPWDGNYHSNVGQFVTSKDADACADALEKAFVDLPDYIILEKPSIIKLEDVRLKDLNSHPHLQGVISAFIEEGHGDATLVNPHLTPLEMFGGRSKVNVQDFIAFCRKGGVEIW